MSSYIKLLPCPFCGGEARTDSCGSHWVKCTVCGARGCVESTRKEAIEQWNIRKPMEHYKLGNCTNDCEHFDNAVTYGYTKAIEDFFDELQNYEDSDDWLRLKMSSIYEIAEQLKKTGRHIDISSLLEQIRGNE